MDRRRQSRHRRRRGGPEPRARWIRLLAASAMLALSFCAGASAARMPSEPPPNTPRPGGHQPLLLAGETMPPDTLQRRVAAMSAFARGVAAEFQDEYSAALEGYREAARLSPPSAQILTRQASCLFELRELDAAREMAERALALDSLQAEAHWVRGISLASRGNLEAAVGPLRRATELGNDRRALHALVNILEQLGRRSELLEPLGALIEAAPSMLRLRERRARLLIELGREAEALKDLQAILATTPDYPGIHERVEALLPLPEKLEARIAFYRELVEQHPGVLDFRWKLVRDLMQGERWDAAEMHLAALEAAEPANPLPMLQRALIAYRQGRTARAFREIGRADSLAPELPLVELWKMRLHFSERQADSALVAAERLLEARPHAVEALRVRAICLLDLGRESEAFRALDAWADQDAEDPQPLALAASLLRRREEWDEGAALMRQAFERAPEDSQLLVDLTLFLGRSGAVEEAEQRLRDFIADHPRDAIALNALGYLLLEHGGELAEARELLERAVEIDPSNPAILDSIGWLWYKEGELGRAEKWLKRAVRQGGQHPEIIAHLARVQTARRRLPEALETIEEGLRHHPRDSGLQTLREELEAEDAREP
ncbi:MAG: tetratricopeptide repeat protein [Candidatus Eisenbacteria bacterium]|nr:tetratricopeptide repeat protein [Candidatus Eisenbacteria bacterium]